MKKILRNILILIVLFSLSSLPGYAAALPAPPAKEQSAQAKKKAAQQKAQEKKKKEQAKARAEKQKEQEKRKAAQQKAQEARAREAAKRQAEQAKAAAKQAEQEEAQKEAYYKQQAELENPKPEVVSLINIGARIGYAAVMDKMNANYSNANSPSQLGSDYVYQSLTGGPGAGLSATYALEYGAFRFETGLDFTWLNSRSDYAFALRRTNYYPNAADAANPVRQTYSYITDDLREVRNVGYIGLPILFGAQFDRYFFMLGAKVGYGIFGTYSQSGRYDIVVEDEQMLTPYGLGIVDVPTEGADDRRLTLRQPEVSLYAEVGLDLDEWLQAQPSNRNKARVKPGQRLPFGREHIHYRISAFAEYGVLNSNGAPAAAPLAFAGDSYLPQGTRTMLGVGNAVANNLFVGVKFTVQFEIPGKVARPVPPPPSYATLSVLDATTEQPIEQSTVSVTNRKNGRVAMKAKSAAGGSVRQRASVGDYQAVAQAPGYYTETVDYAITEPGSQQTIDLRLRKRPVFRVHVTNRETGQAVPAVVQIRPRGTAEARYTLRTDSLTGSNTALLSDSLQYTLYIEQIGYEPYEAAIASIGDSIHVQLAPIQKGEVFVMKNLFFATNKTRILPTSEEGLEALSMFLQRNPDVRIRVMGHTDSVGQDAANQRLSEGRATAVRDDLVKRGVAAERIETVGYGESRPIATNETEEGRQQNRRVEIEIL